MFSALSLLAPYWRYLKYLPMLLKLTPTFFKLIDEIQAGMKKAEMEAAIAPPTPLAKPQLLPSPAEIKKQNAAEMKATIKAANAGDVGKLIALYWQHRGQHEDRGVTH